MARSDKGGRHRVSPFCRRGHDKRISGRYSHGACAECQREKQKAKAADRRELLSAYKLGKGCAQCGYNEHACALQFHHLDPTTKNFSLGRAKETTCDEKMWAEVKKCIVLCANCHAVMTHGEGQ